MSIPPLFPDQVPVRDSILACLQRGVDGTLLVAPTGYGKTVLDVNVISTVIREGWDVFVHVPRREILAQTSKTLTHYGLDHGLIMPGHELTSHRLHVTSIDTVNARLGTLAERLQAADLHTIDEAHHTNSATRARMAQMMRRRLGKTATPWRMDGKPLGEHFNEVVLAPSWKQCIEICRLVDVRVIAPPTKYDLAGVGKTGGDFNKKRLAVVMDDPEITRDAIRAYARFCLGQPCLVFCVDLEHCAHVAEAFRLAGWNAEAIHGEMSARERDALINGFRAGDIQVLVSCEILGEGTDLPSAACGIMLRPTESATVFIQQAGRLSRMFLDKLYAILIDLARNVANHGLPQGDRKWSLNRGLIEPAPSTRRCPACWHVAEAPVIDCPYCDRPYVARARMFAPKPTEVRMSGMAAVGGYSSADIAGMEFQQIIALCTSRHAVQVVADIRGYDKAWQDKVLAHNLKRKGW